MILVTAFLLMITNNAFSTYGGDRVGNGGDVVSCLGKEKLYILEEYEAHSFYRKNLKIGSPEQDFIGKVQTLINIFKISSPVRYEFYQKNFQYFLKHVKFTNNLKDIDDAYEYLNSDCRSIQTAYFKQSEQGQISYYILREIWEKLNSDQKALLVMHELVYTEAYLIGHRSSVYARLANIELTYFNYNPNLFDAQLIKSLRSTHLAEEQIAQYLEHSYSAGIARFYLQILFRNPYTSDRIKNAIILIKERFKENLEISKFVELYLLENALR